jgi:hypothetical protein
MAIFIAVTDALNFSCELSDSLTSIIFSMPVLPKTTGTPMDGSYIE